MSRYDVTMTTYRLTAVSRDLRGGRRRSSLRGVSELVTCDFCGTQAPEDQTLTWSTAVERGRRQVFCDTCSRANLRAMEGKLDSEWW